MTEKTKALSQFLCEVCGNFGRKGSLVVSEGDGLRHLKCVPVPDPAPTVDAMDDVSTAPLCRQGGQAAHSYQYADDDHGNSGSFCVHCEEPEDSTKGPWFDAMYGGTCDSCFDRIEEGDRIRADGQGGYECEDCGEDGFGFNPGPIPWQQQASAAAKRHLAQTDTDTPYVALLKEELRGPHAHSASDAAAMPTPDEFLDPAPVERMFIRSPEEKIAIPTPDEFLDPAEPEVKLNVSGQPPARRDYLKRYIVVDPDLGDFRRTKKERKPFGITRATTFNKHAQNTIALNQWSKRNVVMGASLRPDILRRAHGLHHDKSREEREALDRIVDELETAAGAKVAADEGSFLHEFCDQVDAGLKTWQDAPTAYQQDIKRYVEALAAAGLEPVPGLIERTTFIREYGGVCGTFDRVFYHRPSGQYIVGDLKTGKTMKYAMDETECQIWTYAHGVNQTGIYDWNTDTWVTPLNAGGPDYDVVHEVSETVGVIVHMPVQGPEAGEVYLRFANLERGRAYAELNNAVKSYEKSKVLPFEMPELSWEERFAGATSGEHANQLWREAKAEGITGIRLNDLIAIARTAIASRVDTGS